MISHARATRGDFAAAVRLAAAAAEGGSNDTEIQALQDVRDLACELLDLDPETGDPIA